jgi:anti-sigma B factor antagonist
MADKKLNATVRTVSPLANAIDIQGEISSFSDDSLTKAYEKATETNVRTVILNFTGMTYMNSIGIGMLVRLLIRAQREGKKMAGYGLAEHFKRVFEITQLDHVIPIHDSESVALAFCEPYDLPERED